MVRTSSVASKLIVTSRLAEPSLVATTAISRCVDVGIVTPVQSSSETQPWHVIDRTVIVPSAQPAGSPFVVHGFALGQLRKPFTPSRTIQSVPMLSIGSPGSGGGGDGVQLAAIKRKQTRRFMPPRIASITPAPQRARISDGNIM